MNLTCTYSFIDVDSFLNVWLWTCGFHHSPSIRFSIHARCRSKKAPTVHMWGALFGSWKKSLNCLEITLTISLILTSDLSFQQKSCTGFRPRMDGEFERQEQAAKVWQRKMHNEQCRIQYLSFIHTYPDYMSAYFALYLSDSDYSSSPVYDTLRFHFHSCFHKSCLTSDNLVWNNNHE